MKSIKNIIFIVASAALAIGNVSAQDKVLVKLDIDKPKFEDIKTPDPTGSTTSKKWTQKDWLEMEVKFEILGMKPLPRDKTLPALMVKWVVVAENPTKPKNYIRLTKEVNHVNLPVGEDLYTSCYISPSGVRRLSGGGDNASKRLIYGVGGEFYVNGELVGYFASRDEKVKIGGKEMPFWHSPKLSESTNVQIFSKNETPFEWFWYDRYAELETESNKANKAE